MPFHKNIFIICPMNKYILETVLRKNFLPFLQTRPLVTKVGAS